MTENLFLITMKNMKKKMHGVRARTPVYFRSLKESLASICYIFQPAREARRLVQRTESSRRELSVLWTSRRASAQAVTSKRYIRTTSPVNTYSSGVKTDSRRKTGRSSETKRATGDRWVPKRPKFRCRRRRRFGFFR